MSFEKRIVSTEQLKAFQEDGAVCLRNVFDKKWIDIAITGIQANLASPSQYSEALAGVDGLGIYFNDYCNWTKIKEFKDYVLNSPAAAIAGELMNSNISVFYHEHVLTKEPGTTKKTPWHQDQPYYPFDGFKTCSIWMPVDPVSLDTSLQFVKGSHKWNRCFFPYKFRSENKYPINNRSIFQSNCKMFEEVPEITENTTEYEIITWDLQPGDCLVFNMLTLHGAAGNTAVNVHRRVLSTRWFGDDVTFALRPWEVSPPITGGLKQNDPPHKSNIFPVVWQR